MDNNPAVDLKRTAGLVLREDVHLTDETTE